MSAWHAILATGAGSFALRFVPVTLASRRDGPRRTLSVLALVGPAVLAALAATGVVDAPRGDLIPRAAAALVAVAVAHRTRSVGWTVAVGLVATWALQATVEIA